MDLQGCNSAWVCISFYSTPQDYALRNVMGRVDDNSLVSDWLSFPNVIEKAGPTKESMAIIG